MNRGFKILVILLLGSRIIAAAAEGDVPLSIRNNRFYTESLRQANLARLSFEDGDYDASTRYSEEAMRYAMLSDEYVNLRLKMWETDLAINAASKRLDYAVSIGARSRYPTEFMVAQTAYNEARALRTAERWDDAIDAANRVLAALAFIEPGGGIGAGSGTDGTDTAGAGHLPAQYIVRTWEDYKDCLWNIASRSWAYNNPNFWKVLYDANMSKMPETDNPDLIHPGMVLDIPSVRGEIRQGVWDSGRTY